MTLFTLRKRHSESLREYLAWFNKETIKVSHPNQELFVGAFQHGLRAWQFNESLVQKPASNMDEIITQVECYIKGEESNWEKRSRDSLENSKVHKENLGKKQNQLWSIPQERQEDRPSQKPNRRPLEREGNHTLLNTKMDGIYKEVDHLNLIPDPPKPKKANVVLGKDFRAWCSYHRLRGHTTNDCIQLKREIEILIQRGYLSTYVKYNR